MTRGSRNVHVAIAALLAGASLSLPAASPAVDKQGIFTAANGWYAVANGVYEHQQPDGSITRFAYGPGGAEYDRQSLQSQLAELEARVPADSASLTEIQARIDGIKVSLAVIPEHAGNDIEPFSSTTGLLCSRWQYHFDTHLVVGDAGATAVSRVVLTPNPGGGLVPPPSTVSTATTATVTPASGGTVTSSDSGSTYLQPISAVADWLPASLSSAIGSTACTASTSSSVSVTTGLTCSGSFYASTSQTYSTCVSSP
jgi:hypothetical protein